jgi:hypothetical protein
MRFGLRSCQMCHQASFPASGSRTVGSHTSQPGDLEVTSSGLTHVAISETLTMHKHQFLRVLERRDRQNDGAPRSDVLSIAVTIFIGDIFVAAATPFTNPRVFSAAFWEAASWLVALSSLGITIWWAIRLVRWHRSHPRRTVEEIYEEVIDEMEVDRQRLAAIEARSPKGDS